MMGYVPSEPHVENLGRMPHLLQEKLAPFADEDCGLRETAGIHRPGGQYRSLGRLSFWAQEDSKACAGSEG